MSIKGLFNIDSSCWNVDQRAFQLWPELPPTKSQNLGLDFKWWVHYCSRVFEMCDFHLYLLDFIFIKKTLIDFWWFFEKRFYFWNLKLGIGNWKFWILNFENWNFGILGLANWNLRLWKFENLWLEILNMKFKIFATWNFETRDLKTCNLKSGDFEIWDLRFETWNFETWDFGILRFKNWNLKFGRWNFKSGDFKIWDWIWKLKFGTWEWKFWIENLGFGICKKFGIWKWIFYP